VLSGQTSGGRSSGTSSKELDMPHPMSSKTMFRLGVLLGIVGVLFYVVLTPLLGWAITRFSSYNAGITMLGVAFLVASARHVPWRPVPDGGILRGALRRGSRGRSAWRPIPASGALR
jgi:hypothetical protein